VQRSGQGVKAVIHTTASHLFWEPYHHYWVAANKLSKGERLKTPGGQVAVVEGGSIPADHDGWMWDLTVPGDNDHDFYVLPAKPGSHRGSYSVAGDTAVLVHNTSGCGPVLSGPNPVPRAIRDAYEDINVGSGVQRFNPDGTPDIFTAAHGEPLSVQRQWGGSTVWEVPGARNPGATRILINPRGQMGYTIDHYQTIQMFSGPSLPRLGMVIRYDSNRSFKFVILRRRLDLHVCTCGRRNGPNFGSL
jgi:hypothetical protein